MRLVLWSLVGASLSSSVLSQSLSQSTSSSTTSPDSALSSFSSPLVSEPTSSANTPKSSSPAKYPWEKRVNNRPSKVLLPKRFEEEADEDVGKQAKTIETTGGTHIVPTTPASTTTALPAKPATAIEPVEEEEDEAKNKELVTKGVEVFKSLVKTIMTTGGPQVVGGPVSSPATIATQSKAETKQEAAAAEEEEEEEGEEEEEAKTEAKVVGGPTESKTTAGKPTAAAVVEAEEEPEVTEATESEAATGEGRVLQEEFGKAKGKKRKGKLGKAQQPATTSSAIPPSQEAPTGGSQPVAEKKVVPETTATAVIAASPASSPPTPLTFSLTSESSIGTQSAPQDDSPVPARSAAIAPAAAASTPTGVEEDNGGDNEESDSATGPSTATKAPPAASTTSTSTPAATTTPATTTPATTTPATTPASTLTMPLTTTQLHLEEDGDDEAADEEEEPATAASKATKPVQADTPKAKAPQVAEQKPTTATTSTTTTGTTGATTIGTSTTTTGTTGATTTATASTAATDAEEEEDDYDVDVTLPPVTQPSRDPKPSSTTTASSSSANTASSSSSSSSASSTLSDDSTLPHPSSLYPKTATTPATPPATTATTTAKQPSSSTSSSSTASSVSDDSGKKSIGAITTPASDTSTPATTATTSSSSSSSSAIPSASSPDDDYDYEIETILAAGDKTVKIDTDKTDKPNKSDSSKGCEFATFTTKLNGEGLEVLFDLPTNCAPSGVLLEWATDEEFHSPASKRFSLTQSSKVTMPASGLTPGCYYFRAKFEDSAKLLPSSTEECVTIAATTAPAKPAGGSYVAVRVSVAFKPSVLDQNLKPKQLWDEVQAALASSLQTSPSRFELSTFTDDRHLDFQVLPSTAATEPTAAHLVEKLKGFVTAGSGEKILGQIEAVEKSEFITACEDGSFAPVCGKKIVPSKGPSYSVYLGGLLVIAMLVFYYKRKKTTAKIYPASDGPKFSRVTNEEEDSLTRVTVAPTLTTHESATDFVERSLGALGFPAYGMSKYTNLLKAKHLSTVDQLRAMDDADWRAVGLPGAVEKGIRDALEGRERKEARSTGGMELTSTRPKLPPTRHERMEEQKPRVPPAVELSPADAWDLDMPDEDQPPSPHAGAMSSKSSNKLVIPEETEPEAPSPDSELTASKPVPPKTRGALPKNNSSKASKSTQKKTVSEVQEEGEGWMDMDDF